LILKREIIYLKKAHVMQTCKVETIHQC
jgi:hypothetical protein